MTPQEIQALINAKIAGQGSAVDVGGALPQILSGILEVAQSGAQKTVVEIVGGVGDGTLEEALAALTINGEPATYEKIHALEIGQFIIKRLRLGATEFYEPTYFEKGERYVKIAGGYLIPENDEMLMAKINLDTSPDAENIVYVYEI